MTATVWPHVPWGPARGNDWQLPLVLRRTVASLHCRLTRLLAAVDQNCPFPLTLFFSAHAADQTDGAVELDVHYSAASSGTRWKTLMCLHANGAEWACSSHTRSSDQAWPQKKKEDNAAMTKIVSLAVTQYLTENHSKVVLGVIQEKKKWRRSFSHFDKKNNNERTDCVIMAGAASSPQHGDRAAQKTHLTRKRATIGFCARENKGPAFPIWLPCTLIDTLQGLPSINKSVSPTTQGFL